MKIVAIVAGAAIASLMAGFAFVAQVLGAATGASGLPPTAAAVADIPAELLPIYQAAAAGTCGMPWQVLAATGKVESDHGRSNLPGVRSGANSAGAIGPMQFLPATWAAYGVDGDGDGDTDVYDSVDAIWGAANYLCANGAGDPALLADAVWAYNHSTAYVDTVLAVAASYAGLIPGAAGSYALPVDRSIFDAHPEYLSKPHHDYPAIDIPLGVGTPVFAVAAGEVLYATADDSAKCGGTVLLAGADGYEYVYCHGSSVLVSTGGAVTAGQLLMLSGGEPGASGAGNSSGPHLHFGVEVGGVDVCPQPLLTAWYLGQHADPSTAPTAGCSY